MSLIDFQPKRILIIRLSAIGDIIMGSALIPVLSKAYPEAKLVWLTEETNADLLKHNSRLEQVLIWPRRRWRDLRRQGHYLALFQEFRKLVRELRSQRFDLVLDLQGLLKSGVWAWLSGGATRIGLGSKEGSQWLMTKTLSAHTTTRKIGSEYQKLAEALGLNPAGFEMDIQLSEPARQEAQTLLAQAGVDSAFAVLCPFTTRPQKHWFEECWIGLARRLARERGIRIVVLGGPGDEASAERLSQAEPGLVNLAGRTTLAQCAAIIEKASLLVGVDTGLTHLGTAMRTPTIALFGSTRPYLYTGTARSKVLYAGLPCSPCRRRPTCEGRFDCMRQHTDETVFAEATTLLSETDT